MDNNQAMANDLESTKTLLNKVKSGDKAASERLCAVFIPKLKNWAHGRLPLYARDLTETDDLVQSSFLKALSRLHEFEPQREGAFLAYLRQIMINDIRMELRRHSHLAYPNTLDYTVELFDQEASVLQQLIGSEAMASYETSLIELKEHEREAVLMRLEFGYSFPEIASAMALNSPNAARMKVSRALQKMAELMYEHQI